MLQKKANTVLPSKTIIGKFTPIYLGIALISALSITILQLKKHKKIITYIFGICHTEKNKKWAKYLLCRVLQQILTLEMLEDMISKIIAQVQYFSSFATYNRNKLDGQSCKELKKKI